jgi:hypothetical protein
MSAIGSARIQYTEGVACPASMNEQPGEGQFSSGSFEKVFFLNKYIFLLPALAFHQDRERRGAIACRAESKRKPRNVANPGPRGFDFPAGDQSLPLRCWIIMKVS